MASIQSLGIGSGLLTADLAEQIIAAEREAVDLRLDVKTARVEAQITAYGEVKSALASLQNSATALSSANNIRKTNATSSNTSALTATTSSIAETGSYNIQVNSIAKSHTIASQSYTSVTDTVGTGTLTFRFGTYEYDVDDEITGFTQNSKGREFNIELTSANNTLSGVRDAINRANMGVQASLVNDGNGYRLLLSTREAGSDNAMEISVAGDGALQALGYSAQQNAGGSSSMTQTQRAEDANVLVNGLEITSRSNQLSEVIRGVNINLVGESAGSTVNLTISRDPASLVESVGKFIEDYNFFLDVYREVTKFDEGSKTSGLLLGDGTLRTVNNQVRSSLSQIVAGLENEEFRSLADVGIFTDRNDNFRLGFDTARLEAAIASSIDSVTGLFASTNDTTDSLINYVSKTDATKPGTYDIEVTQLATQAKMLAKPITEPSAMNPLVISASNDSFRINVDGTSATIDLLQGTYDNVDDVVLMIQNAINNNEALTARGRSVTVEFNATEQRFEVTSSLYGSSSQVSIVDADPMVANTLGFTLPSQGGFNGQFYSTLNDLAFGATTIPAGREVSQDISFDFSQNTVSFDLLVDLDDGNGPQTVSVTLNENMANLLDINGNVSVARDRSDMLNYLNGALSSALNTAGIPGAVTASFNASNRLVFSTEVAVGNQSITLDNVDVQNGIDVLGLASAEGTSTSGVTISPNTEFKLSYFNRNSNASTDVIEVPAGVYETPEALALAIQTAINDDPVVQSGATGAITPAGARLINNNIDFVSRPASFEFDYNGDTFFVDVTANGANNLESIQNAIDAALVAGGRAAGDVIARNMDGGLSLETLITGSAQVLSILGDGRGDVTAPGAIISGGIDFSADPVEFTLRVDGIDIAVALDADMSAATVDETMVYIQERLDAGLLAAGSGGQFTLGDVIARLDADDRLVFESQSRNGVKTNSTFGALASLAIVDANAAADTTLGVVTAAAQSNGRDAFQLEQSIVQGFDAEVTVSYSQDAEGRGRFSLVFDNQTTVQFTAVSTTAVSQLGFNLPDGSENDIATGKDVRGTINGLQAVGRGQLLTAAAGTQAATNGYVLGSPGFDFTSAVELDSDSNMLKVVIDGVASGEIRLTETVYASGRALADEMQRAINADSALAAAGKTVNVQFDPATNRFGIISVATGVQSTARVAEIQGPLSNVLGLSTASETVAGKAASGQTDPASGLQVRVLGGQLGSRGSVTYISGIFEQLGKLFKNMLNTGGGIDTRLKGLDREMERINEEKERLNIRMAAQEQRLKAQFLFNDKIVSRLNSTENFLSQQFDIMNGMLANRKK